MDIEYKALRNKIEALIKKRGLLEVEDKVGIVEFQIKGRRMLHTP